jgi:hypothetical protein
VEAIQAADTVIYHWYKPAKGLGWFAAYFKDGKVVRTLTGPPVRR